jgi:hypothetical protein
MGCKSHVLTNKIEKLVSDHNRDTFRIELNSLISQQWDSMYSFREYTSCVKFEKIFSGSCEMPQVPDACYRYVFSYKNKVVYWEDVKFGNRPQFYISNDSSKNDFVISISQKYLFAEKIRDEVGNDFFSIHPVYEK